MSVCIGCHMRETINKGSCVACLAWAGAYASCLSGKPSIVHQPRLCGKYSGYIGTRYALESKTGKEN